KVTGAAKITGGELAIEAINGEATAHAVTWNRQAFGDIAFTAATRGNDLLLGAAAQVREVSVQAQGSWQLNGQMPGRATVKFSRANLATVHSLVTTDPPANTTLPFEGFIDGAAASIEIALRRPRDFRAELSA